MKRTSASEGLPEIVEDRGSEVILDSPVEIVEGQFMINAVLTGALLMKDAGHFVLKYFLVYPIIGFLPRELLVSIFIGLYPELAGTPLRDEVDCAKILARVPECGFMGYLMYLCWPAGGDWMHVGDKYLIFFITLLGMIVISILSTFVNQDEKARHNEYAFGPLTDIIFYPLQLFLVWLYGKASVKYAEVKQLRIERMKKA